MGNRYFLRDRGETEWREVDRRRWIEAERSAGFRPKLASTDARYMEVCATGGFTGNGIEGRLDYEWENSLYRA